MTDHPQTKGDLWEKVYHTDARVSAMESELSNVAAVTARIEHHLLNKPPVNFAAWVGIGITILSLAVAGLFGISQYIQLTLQPIQQALLSSEAVNAEYQQFRQQTAYELGVAETERKFLHKEIDHDHEQLHALRDNISRIDSEGSRVWASQNKE